VVQDLTRIGSGTTETSCKAPAAPAAWAGAQRLVLWVGAAARPDRALLQVLARDGVRCLWLATADEAVRAARHAVVDAAVLDAALADGAREPGLAQLRVLLRCPLLVVAQQADEVDEIMALELGADAFVAQPLAGRRLRAHLRALWRARTPLAPLAPPAPALQPAPPATGASDAAVWQGFRLERGSDLLSGQGRCVALSPVQSRLLQRLMDAGGRPVPRAALVPALPRSGVSARTVDAYISRLRKRLDGEGLQALQLQSARGCGYALRAAPPPAHAAAGAEPAFMPPAMPAHATLAPERQAA
jgi:DNA-binding response OmpR family regulator